MEISQESKIIQHEITGVRFDMYTPEMTRKISIKKITNPIAFDNLGRPNPDGLYDLAMGPSPYDNDSLCVTCRQDQNSCTGHFGHIELIGPVYNPLMFNVINKLLRSKCFNCHKLKIKDKLIIYYYLKLILIKLGYLGDAKYLDNLIYSPVCPNNNILDIIGAFFINKDVNLNLEEMTVSTEEANTYEMENTVNEENINDDNNNEEEETDENLNEKGKKRNKKKTQKNNKKEKEDTSFLVKPLTETKIKNITRILEKLKDKIGNLEADLNIKIMQRQVMSEFWKSLNLSKCMHCNSRQPKIIKQNNSKFFMIPLSKKEKKRMKFLGLNPERDALEDMVIDEDIHDCLNKKKGNKNEFDIDEEEEEEEKEIQNLVNEKNMKLMHPLEVQKHIYKLWENNKGILEIIFGNIFPNTTDSKQGYEIRSTGPDIFFLNSLIVPPNRFRPESKGIEGVISHEQTQALTKIMNLNNQLISLNLKKESDEKEVEEKMDEKNNKIQYKDVITTWIELQEAINVFFDSSKSTNKNEKEGKGIRQRIERKEGLFRMNMMGKRVNYAGRSVISPDPFINSNEVGIPLIIASKLTYPERVTKFNLDFMKKLCMNGPTKYPGAKYIEDDNGRLFALDTIKNESFKNNLIKSLDQGNKIVHRHLLTNDILLVNRQPTLHKPSIMSHRARVLPGEKTIRLHYANCNAYNADFDGDEMNIHLLQDHISRQEAYIISNTDNQYLVPTSGKPIRGLIQDSIVSSLFITLKDTFFEKEYYMQIVYFALESPLNRNMIDRIELLPPCIFKPKPLWSGKQVISTVLKSLSKTSKYYKVFEGMGLNMEHRCKIPDNMWGKPHLLEGVVNIRDNELLTGVLDKNHVGNSEYGLIHSYYEMFGPEMAGELISTFGRLFIHYLQFFHGFTCGVDDLIIKDDFDYRRKEQIETILQRGMNSLANFFEKKDCELSFDNYSNRGLYSRKDHNDIIEKSDIIFTTQSKDNLIKLFSKQDSMSRLPFKNTVSSENLNKIVNISSSFKENILKNDTIDKNIDIVVKNAINETTSSLNKFILPNGSIKPWPYNYFSLMVQSGAKGSIVNHYQISSMLGQQELEGRRVPRMASGKTLPSFMAFDPNPRAGGFISDRFSTGIRPQEFFFHCMAGREGLIDTAVKTSRSGYLQRCLIKHLEQLVVNYDYTVRDYDGNIIQFLYGEDCIDVINNKFLNNFKFIAQNNENYSKKFQNLELIDKKKVREYVKKLKGDIEQEANETLLNKFSPWLHLGSMSDKLWKEMGEYLNKDPQKYFKFKLADKREFRDNVFSKYLKSLVSPGESVGIIAAQSIGEPSTQMTLNTFHLAGHGGANMTLGIPRLREILMTSENNIQTPIMVLPLYSNNRAFVEKFSRKFERHNLINLVKKIDIKKKIYIHSEHNIKQRVYYINIHFEKIENIKKYFDVSAEYIKKCFNDIFITNLVKTIARHQKNEHRQNINETIKKIIEKEKKIKEELGNPEDDEKLFYNNDKKNPKNEDEEASHKEEEDDNEEDEEDDYNIDKEELQDGNINADEDKNDEEENEEEGRLSIDNIRVEKLVFDEKRSLLHFILKIPLEQKGILLKNILDTTLKKINFISVEGIKKCHILTKKNKENGREEFSLQFEGINFFEVFKYDDFVNINEITTNDIGTVLRIYGIEAARNMIVKEINNVFQSYSIAVDNRHLGLVADYMTYQGYYRSFNRVGMELSSSPFLKMSFETSMNYIVQCCSTKDLDNAKSPSSQIVLGLVPKVGTGMFSILQNIVK